jgi:hypothetical protein
MAWTAPASWTVSEIVTAAKMNTHVRDNFDYLKGNAGAVTIADALTTADSISTVSDGSSAGVNITSYRASAFGSRVTFLSARGSLGAPTQSLSGDLIGRFGAGGRTNAGAFGSEVARLDFVTSEAYTATNQGCDIQFVTTPVGSTTGAAQARLTGSGRLGIGSVVAAAPQGTIHGYDSIGGFLHWKYDGVDGTARTVIPDGAGDVLYYATGLFQVRTSGGALSLTGSSLGILSPGTSQDLYNNAGNILSFAVAANGSVTVQRTGGALTYKVNLWLLWM